ncbi:hypothetical protein D3C76_1287560 [compost metagenome]
MILHRHEPGPAVILRNMQSFEELPSEHGGSTYVPCFPCLHHIMQSFHCFFNRRIVVPAVNLVQIHIVSPETLQAIIDLTQDSLAGKPRAVRSLMHTEMNLRRNDDLVSIRVILQSPTYDFLTRPRRIYVGCIEKVDAEIKSFFDDWTAPFLVENPWMRPTARITKTHAAKTKPRYVHAGIAQFHIFHIHRSSLDCVPIHTAILSHMELTPSQASFSEKYQH